jgi:HSP20 family molecular chaperone IbpA
MGPLIRVCAHVPEIKKTDVFVDVGDEGKQIIITGELKESAMKGPFTIKEIKRGKFVRKIKLDCQVDANKVESSFVDGKILDLLKE